MPNSLSATQVGTVGWMGAGLGVTVVAGRIFINGSDKQEPVDTATSSPEPTATGVPTSTSNATALSLQTFPFETVTVDGQIFNYTRARCPHYR